MTLRAVVRRLALAVLLLPFAYLLAALVGSAIPANADWREPREGVTIYVADNGIHTGLILPAANSIHDWRPLVKATHLRDPRYAAGGWLEFGWGDRDFYLNTPTWSDFNLATALHAAIGGVGTLIHVDHLSEPEPGPSIRRLTLTPEQYRRLTLHILASFDRDLDGRATPVGGYGLNDVFYPARGRYSAIRTCNSWAGGALKAAGVRVGRWTPFSAMVIAWMPTSGARPNQSH